MSFTVRGDAGLFLRLGCRLAGGCTPGQQEGDHLLLEACALVAGFVPGLAMAGAGSGPGYACGVRTPRSHFQVPAGDIPEVVCTDAATVGHVLMD